MVSSGSDVAGLPGEIDSLSVEDLLATAARVLTGVVVRYLGLLAAAAARPSIKVLATTRT